MWLFPHLPGRKNSSLAGRGRDSCDSNPAKNSRADELKIRLQSLWLQVAINSMANTQTYLPDVGLIREPVVLAHVGIGRTRWREMVKAGQAPSPTRISERVSVYSAAEIRAWIAERIDSPAQAKQAAPKALAGDVNAAVQLLRSHGFTVVGR